MKMRFFSLIGILVLLINTPIALAAEGSPETFQKALEEAKARNHLVLLDFTGSDWCPPCMMLEKQVFSTPEFKKFAQNDIIFMEIDFPRQKKLPESIQKRNEALAAEFNVEAFPTLILFNPSGKELARKVGFVEGGPTQLIEWVTQYRSK